MSEETERNLEEARTAVAAARAAVEALKQECLNGIAEDLPAAVDGIAKRTAQAQPEVTKTNGADGIKSLRRELAMEAAPLAENIREALTIVDWPIRDSEWSKVAVTNIHSALFKTMFRGEQIDRIGEVFYKHGYDVHRHSRDGRQGLVLPQHLYDQSKFGDLADAINHLGAAEIRYKKAKELNDADVVESIWGES